MSMRLIYLGASLVIGSLAFGLAGVAVAEEPRLPTERTPLMPVLDAQDTREAQTIARLRTALNQDGEIGERVEALSTLGGVEYDYVLANGEALLSGPPELARQMVSIIGAEIAMLPAHQMEGETLDPLSQYQRMVVQRSVALLEEALAHPDPDVRLDAIAVMVVRGNTEAIVAIEDLIKTGEIDTRKGIGYISLAPNQIASPFLEKYMLEGAPNARAAAISQVAYNPAYTEQVREIALRPGTPDDVTAAALPGLSRTDSTFLEYGLALVNDSERPAFAREAALTASLDALAAWASDDRVVESTVARALKQASESLGTPSAIEAYRAYEIDQLKRDR